MPSRLLRAALASPLVLVGLGTGVAVSAGGPAQAAGCPNASTTTVSASPSYRYTRGCIDSFDGTPIVYNLFEPLDASKRHHVFTVLEGPGWGSAGDTTPDANLLKADYAFLTWDPRGFGQSGGVAEVDSPESEGRDVSALISDVLATRSEIARDTSKHSSTFGQPAVGMLGASYGGGIQLSTAAFDRRAKAIVPEWAWNDLDYSLYPGGALKFGWDELLYGAGEGESAAAHLQTAGGQGTAGTQTGGLDPNIHQAEAKGLATGVVDQQTLAWFKQRSMVSWGAGREGHVPQVPTLLVQGTVDTLFNLNEAVANLDEIKAHDPHTVVKLIAFCGGHVSCPTGSGYSATPPSGLAKGVNDDAFIERAAINWFDTYLRHDKGARDTLPPVLAQDQTGVWHSYFTFATEKHKGAAKYLTAAIPSSTLAVLGAPEGAGDTSGTNAVTTDGANQSGDPTAVTVPVLTKARATTYIVGEPHVDVTVTVDGPASNLFFKLVDAQTGKVLDLQTAALRIDNLDLANSGNGAQPPTAQHYSLDLVGVAYALPKGDTLQLQVATSALPFAPNRTPGVLTVSGTVSVPTLTK